jgi:hypothetical protein
MAAPAALSEATGSWRTVQHSGGENNLKQLSSHLDYATIRNTQAACSAK